MAEDKGTALVRIGPDSMDELFKFASSVSASGFYGFDSADKAFVAISAGMDLGLSHAQSARAWHIIEGKPTLTADAMRAVCLASPHCEYFTVREKSGTVCTMATKRRGEPTEQVVTWTIDDAKRAGVYKETDRNGKPGMWVKFPRQMLQARATAELARQVYPDLLLGIYAPEEIEADTVAAAPVATPAREPEPVAAEVVANGHHPTWDRDRARFCAVLGELGLRYEDVADYTAAHGKTGQRPSAMTTQGRDKLLDGLRAGGAAKVAAWVAERVVAPVVAEREPGEEG